MASQVKRRLIKFAALAMLAGAIVLAGAAGLRYTRERQVRDALYAAFAPVRVTNCTLQRYGEANDGGYLMCANFLPASQAGYSYGIDGRDGWGCDVATATKIPVHQYDCFNTTAPACASGPTMFHTECVGPERAARDGRTFDTVASHINTNGDTGKRLVVKMDVEGDEWQSLAAAPDYVLEAIDQMAVEFHRVERADALPTAERLRQFFYVAHVHYNNYECRPGYEPFPGPVFEVLLVNKRIAVADPWVDARGPSPLDAPNAPEIADCQAAPAGTELHRIARWTWRRTGNVVRTLRNLLQR